MRVASVVLSSADPRGLGAFYQQLLGYDTVANEPPAPGAPEADGWVVLRCAEPAAVKLSFQYEPDYTAPTWPPRPGDQAMMMHLDIASEDLQAAVEWALAAGASLAGHQPQPGVRVLLDPAGHPFCLFVGQV
jgi:hypothetical protein